MNKTTMCGIIKLLILQGDLIIPQYYFGCRIIQINCRINVIFDINHPTLKKDELGAQGADRQ